MWSNYLFVVSTKGSELEGEEFFVYSDSLTNARKDAETYFPNEVLTCLGKYSDDEAEWMGLDTY